MIANGGYHNANETRDQTNRMEMPDLGDKGDMLLQYSLLNKQAILINTTISG